MTRPSRSRTPAPAEPAADREAGPGKQASGLAVACLAATTMILLQAGLGYVVAEAATVPAGQGDGILDATWRALSHRPVALALHAGLGLILIITGVSVIVRAILARRNAVLATAVVGLAAILAANVTGAKFASTGKDIDSTVMAVASLVALACYLVCLGVLRGRHPAGR